MEKAREALDDGQKHFKAQGLCGHRGAYAGIWRFCLSFFGCVVAFVRWKTATRSVPCFWSTCRLAQPSETTKLWVVLTIDIHRKKAGSLWVGWIIADSTSMHWWQQVLFCRCTCDVNKTSQCSESTQRNSTCSLWIAGKLWYHLHASFTSRSMREQAWYWSSKQTFIFTFLFIIIFIFLFIFILISSSSYFHPHIFIILLLLQSYYIDALNPEFLRLKLEREHGDDTSIEVSAQWKRCRFPSTSINLLKFIGTRMAQNYWPPRQFGWFKTKKRKCFFGGSRIPRT